MASFNLLRSNLISKSSDLDETGSCIRKGKRERWSDVHVATELKFSISDVIVYTKAQVTSSNNFDRRVPMDSATATRSAVPVVASSVE